MEYVKIFDILECCFKSVHEKKIFPIKHNIFLELFSFSLTTRPIQENFTLIIQKMSLVPFRLEEFSLLFKSFFLHKINFSNSPPILSFLNTCPS